MKARDLKIRNSVLCIRTNREDHTLRDTFKPLTRGLSKCMLNKLQLKKKVNIKLTKLNSRFEAQVTIST